MPYNTCEQVQEFLDKDELLVFTQDGAIIDTLEIESEGIMGVIKAYFSANQKYSTSTFSNPTHTETIRGRRRSIGDIYRTLKFYLPEITLKEIKEGLVQGIEELSLQTFICSDIHKRVWRVENSSYKSFHNVHTDEFSMEYREELSKYPVKNTYTSTEGRDYLNIIM